jgi:hypothetical protein
VRSVCLTKHQARLLTGCGCSLSVDAYLARVRSFQRDPLLSDSAYPPSEHLRSVSARFESNCALLL